MMLATIMAYAAKPASTYTVVSIAGDFTGDLNSDGQINTGDVSTLYKALLNGSSSSKYDINGDGVVNTGDVSQLYKIILGGASTLPATTITMNEYQWVTSSSSAGNHVWQTSGEVIFITIDGEEQNKYTLVLDNGEWLLKDLQGSSQDGFAESGTLKALWVRNANWQSAQVNKITIPYDYATGAGTYKRSGNKVSIQLNLSLAESLVQVPTSEVSELKEMTYASHVTEVYEINRLCDGETNEFACSVTTTAPKKYFNNGYWVIGKHNDVVNGKTVLHKTKTDGRSYRATQDYKLNAGGKTVLSGYWTRDFTLRYYDGDNTRTTQVLYTSSTPTTTIYMSVGSEITFYPQEGSVACEATLTNRGSYNRNVVDFISDPASNSQAIKAISVGGEIELYIVFMTKEGETVPFHFNVIVEPAIWLAGSYNGKPALFRNNVLQYGSLSVDATTIKQVFVRKGTAYIRTYNSAAPNAAVYLMRSTNPLGHGSFYTRYNTNVNHFFVSREGDIWYTNGNNIYKNSSLMASPTGVICDLVQDESSGTNYMWASGYVSSSNATEPSSTDVAWLLENIGSSQTRHVMVSDKVVTDIGGYQPNGYYSGDRSPHFGKMTMQYNFVLIDGFDVEEHAYRDYNGYIHPSIYNVDATYTFDATNGFLRQNKVKYPREHNFFFENQTNERVYFLDSYGRLKYHNLRGNTVNEVNTGLPNLRAIRYVNGILYAYGDGKIYIGEPDKFSIGTFRTIYLPDFPTEINDMFVETDCRN